MLLGSIFIKNHAPKYQYLILIESRPGSECSERTVSMKMTIETLSVLEHFYAYIYDMLALLKYA